jgi:nucleotide-binding universal stress UspA family protein
MSTHGRGGVGRALFGSVAEGALNEAAAPFLLVGPHVEPEARLGDVVVPLDGSHRAESILPVVTDWARATDAALWLVEVVDPKDATKVSDSSEDVSEQAYVERIAAGLPDDLRAVEWDVLHGNDPASAIRAYADEHELPVIAIATHGHTGLSRLVAGSVASRVVHDHTGVALVIRTADPKD